MLTDEEKIFNSSTKTNEPSSLKLIESKLHRKKPSPIEVTFLSFRQKNHSNEFNQNNNINASSSAINNTIKQNSSYLTANSVCSVRQKVPDYISNIYPDLQIEEKGGNLLKGKKILIHPNGLHDSKRKAKDGFVFFGEIKNSHNDIINDVILSFYNDEEDNDTSKIPEHFFVIYFKLSLKKYYIRPFYNAQMSFIVVKLSSLYKIHNNECIVYSDYVMVVNMDDKDGNWINITKVYTKEIEDEIAYRYNSEYGKITIGRDPNCTICFEKDMAFSKINTTIYYDNNDKCWYVADGGEKPSLNGTWIMIRHSYEIHDGCQFKCFGNSTFYISVKPKVFG